MRASAVVLLAACSSARPTRPPAPTTLGPYGQEVAADEPVAHFRMAGPAVAAISTSDADGATSFRDQAIELELPRDLDAELLTIEAWVRLHARDAEVFAVDRLRVLASDGAIQVALAGEQRATSAALEVGAWHHLALTYRAADGTAGVFIDGVPAAEVAFARGTALRGRSVNVGGRGHGDVDEVAVHERVLARTRLLSHVLVAGTVHPPTPSSASVPIELRPQRGHRSRVSIVAATPDGALALTGDGVDLRLWDATSGREVRAMPALTLPSSRAIDPTGRFAIVRSSMGAALLELATGVQRSLPLDQGFQAGVFTPDGRQIVATSSSADAHVTLHDVATGRERARIRGVKEGAVDGLHVSANGKWLAFRSSNWLRARNGVNVVALAGLAGTRSVADTEIALAGAPHEVYGVAFLDGDRAAATVCEHKNPHSDCARASIRVVDLAARREVAALPLPLGTPVRGTVVSDERNLVAFASGSDVEVWDVRAGASVARATMHEATGAAAAESSWIGGVRALALAGGALITTGDDGAILVSSFPDLRPIRRMASPLPDVERAMFGPDGRHVIVATRAGVHRWDLDNLRVDRHLRHKLESVGALALSADGKLALVAGGIEVRPRDLPPPWQARWNGPAGVPTVGAWQILDLDQRRPRALVRGHIADVGGGRPSVIAAAFSEDAQWVATGDATGDLKAWPASIAPERHGFARARVGATFQLAGDERWSAVAVSRGGAFVAGATPSGRIRVIVATATPPRQARDRGYFADEPDDQLALDARQPVAGLDFTGDTLVATSPHGERRAWRIAVDTSSGSPRITATPGAVARVERTVPTAAELARLGSPVRVVVDDHGGPRHAAIMDDQTVAVWARETARAVRLAAVDSRWVAYAGDGTFDASADGADLVATVAGTQAFGIDQFAVQLNRPERLLANLDISRPELVAHFAAQHQRRLRKAGVVEQAPAIGRSLPRASIIASDVSGATATVTAQLASVLDLVAYNVFVNGVPVHAPPGKPVGGKRARIVEPVALSAGMNRIEVAAVDARGVESYRALTFANRADRPASDLYVLAFGVSKYRDPALDLKYAAKDARDLSAMLGRATGYRNVHVKTYEDAQVTVSAIREARSFLAAATVDDVFVLAIMGHGVHDSDPAATYYFVTHEADLDRLARTSASFEQIESLLLGIAPRKKLFLMDTCESGELDPTASTAIAAVGPQLSHRGLVRVKGGATAARPYVVDRDRFVFLDVARRSGAVVFSSSGGGELSYEDGALEQGLFTHAVMDALGSRSADLDGNGRLSIGELRAHVAAKVEIHSGGRQHPTVDRDNIAITIELPLIAP